jgi:hypothetical protein
MSAVAEKTDPKLWDKVKAKVTKGDKGGKPGQWSARKAQMASHEYQAAGSGYRGKKTADNHLEQWQEEDWGTKSGHTSAETGERYLPKTAREHLTDAEYKRTTAKKRADSLKGKQFSAQPKDVAAKTARDRKTGHATTRPGDGPSKAELMRTARARNIPGRSKMTKAELEKAVA